jgi:hypothetical protein
MWVSFFTLTVATCFDIKPHKGTEEGGVLDDQQQQDARMIAEMMERVRCRLTTGHINGTGRNQALPPLNRLVPRR